MMIPMMFRPLNQIANKFNTLKWGWWLIEF